MSESSNGKEATVAIEINKGEDAIVIVDVQNDFCPGGSLAAPGGDAVVAVFNAIINFFLNIFKTQDWHPADHGSFASTHNAEPFSMGKLGDKDQVMWPTHCVQYTRGAELHPNLKMVQGEVIVRKGTDKNFDSYSGVRDDGGADTGLVGMLRERGIKRVFVGGLATDYCVKATAIDLVEAGFEVWVVTDGCRGIADNDDAFNEMVAAGCNLCTSDEFAAA